MKETDAPNNQNNQQQDNSQNNKNKNDLIIDQGFPALNTFQLSSTTNGTSTSSPPGEPSQQDPIPRYPFASFPSALKFPHDSSSSSSSSSSSMMMQDLLHDCQIAFTARTKEDSSAYSSGSTFFIPALMKPRCALERLALDIFQAHTKDLEPGTHYDLERSGAEWWTLVLDTSSKNRTSDGADGNQDDEDGDDDDDDDDEVGMHFDADYGLEHQLPHYMVHPRVATVTYLSNVGVPTLVLNRKSPPPTDVEKMSLNGPVDKGWLSYPMVGKHIAFDGRLLHGAPGTFFPAMSVEEDVKTSGNDAKKRRLNENVSEEESKNCMSRSTTTTCPQRITFLVNIWLNHCPIDAELLDDDLCGQMKMRWNGGNEDENEKKKSHSSDDELKNNQETSIHQSKKRDANEPSDDIAQSFSPWIWNLQHVSNPPKVPKVVAHSAKGSKQAAAAGTDECVICGREVDIHYQSKMNVLHKISSDTCRVEGKSMEIEFESQSVEIVVGGQVEDSDDDDDSDEEEE